MDQYGAQRILTLSSFLSVSFLVTAFTIIHYGQLIGALYVIIGSGLSALNNIILRSIWSKITKDETTRKALHNLDSTLEELIYIFTPLIVSSLWAFLGPDSAILLAASSIALGTFLHIFYFAHYAGEHVNSILDEKVGPNTTKRDKATSKRRSIIFTKSGIGLILPMFGFALAMGMSKIIYVAWSSTYYTSSLVGLLSALTSMGGLIGGLLYGKIKLSDQITTKLYFILPMFFGVCMIPMALTSSLIIVLIVSLMVGLAITPLFVAAYMRVPHSFHKKYYNEANALIGSTYNIGSGIGSILVSCLAEYGTIALLFICASLSTFIIPM
ncbi:MFS transporter [Bartonella rattaustraliani]|uniref:MFS transporter n=1 Tax=Bartonella rattaustraliani TaxID=481139 RepID=UPI0002F4CC40|nr:MFS transporter [Bartonella rattaustraliani]